MKIFSLKLTDYFFFFVDLKIANGTKTYRNDSSKTNLNNKREFAFNFYTKGLLAFDQQNEKLSLCFFFTFLGCLC